MRQKKEADSLMKAAKNMYSDLDEKLGPKDMRSLKLAGVSGSANLFVGAGKLGLGIFSLSFFTCVKRLLHLRNGYSKIFCACRNTKGEKQTGAIPLLLSVWYNTGSGEPFVYRIFCTVVFSA